MGIEDSNKVIEQWLAKVAPGAFFYKLPRGVILSLIVQDLSVMLVGSFMNSRNTTGFDFIQNLVSPVIRFSNSPSDLDSTSIDFEDASLDSKGPTVEVIEEWRINEHERFDTPTTNNALLILTRDNPLHMPANRDLLHEDRYKTSDNIRDQPFTEDEIRSLGLHVCKQRALPGVNPSTMETSDGLGVMRARANRTPMLRHAYQNYGPWALAREVREGGEHVVRTGVGLPHKRRVMIDSVLEDFPADYESKEVWQLPEKWSYKPQKTHCYNLDGSEAMAVDCLDIGEADRKMVWYIENCAHDGDHVLIRSNDSDILFILMMNMHRFKTNDRKKPWRRWVFLDMNTANMKKDRLRRRFVCINLLIQALEDSKNFENPLAGVPHPAHVITTIALICGSDYTQNPYGLGAGKIMDLFETVAKNKSVYGELQDMIRLGEPHVKDPGSDIETKDYPEHMSTFDFILLDEESYDTFLRRLYQTRLTQKTIKQFSVNTSILLGWSKLESYLNEQDKGKKTAENLRVPCAMEREGDRRRLLWTLHYWGNCHHNHGDFPSADIEDPESGLSIWGWARCRKLLTRGDGQDRFINKIKIELDMAKQMDYEEKNIKEHTANPWVCTKTNAIVGFDDIWHAMGAEMILRARNGVKHLKMPLWYVPTAKT